MITDRKLSNSHPAEETIGVRPTAATGVHRRSPCARLARTAVVCCVVIHLPCRLSGQTAWQPSGNDTYVPAGVRVGVGTATPAADLDIGGLTADGALRAVFARQWEGNATGAGTFLGVRAWGTQYTQHNGKMFSVENAFYGTVNSSIEFYRGGSVTGGFMAFTTSNGTERVRIDSVGNVGIGTPAPQRRLHIYEAAGWPEILIESSYNQSAIGRMWGLSLDATDGRFTFRALNGGLTASNNVMTLDPGGNVGVGTLAPQYKFAVNGVIGTREVVVTDIGWADYVLRPDYRLTPLTHVAAYIREHGRLPEIPSAEEVKAAGLSLGEMQVRLLAKIEELTLHLIQLDERNRELEHKIQELANTRSR